MSIETLQSEVRILSPAERRKLLAFIIALEDQERADYAAQLSVKIDNKSPERWLTAEQCERKLGLSGDPK